MQDDVRHMALWVLAAMAELLMTNGVCDRVEAGEVRCL